MITERHLPRTLDAISTAFGYDVRIAASLYAEACDNAIVTGDRWWLVDAERAELDGINKVLAGELAAEKARTTPNGNRLYDADGRPVTVPE